MSIHLAKSAGFCFGVDRAVTRLQELAKERPVATLGPIIHNQQAVERLQEQGIYAVESIDELAPGTTLAIRTHGVAQAVVQELENRGVDYVDLTCPFVKKIHRIVAEQYQNGRKIVIVGDKNHPEVVGINGWCENNAILALDIFDLHGKIEEYDLVCVVSQTTMDRKTFTKIEKFIKDTCKDPLIFDTICSATNERQQEAVAIAKQSDVMVVVGGRHSANTRKLAELCQAHCGAVYQIEHFGEFPQNIKIPNQKIGITAGASTPPWIIKEVVGEMEEMNTMGNESFAQEFEEYEKSLVTLNTGDIVKGTVMAVTEAGVSVNLGYKSDGFIPAGEVSDDPDADIAELVKPGDEIEVFVVRVNDVEGEVTLSKKKLDSIASAREVEEAAETKAILKGKIVQAVNGGVIASYKGTRVFIPASQASDRYITDLNALVGQEAEFRVLEVKKIRGRSKIIGSIKDVLKERKAAAAETFWSSVEVGKTYQGVVKSLTKFGAFVDVGGVDGLVHISELSWGKIGHPSEVLKEGDVAEVYILEFDKEKGKISLGFKKAEDNPWVKAKAELSVGAVIDCKIVRIVPFGAFAEIYPGVDGLIHISQVANKRIGKVEDELMVGQHVKAKVVELDFDAQKIGLSIRALLEEQEAPAAEEAVAEEVAAPVEEAVAEEVVEASAEEVAEATEE
ncbi:MAG: bifunctional 4-hydroxy-3-methylbut-2-enyl diphosphate reductase/30S ribosomal protein S1 [Ruminococcaceae bacterium]|nr:bifunctional 4-hydroxy-3-methylbut-2-enyl diphosphate reductase/30S ribosomal protein S1 [Oscillospiraceae bacterium]